MKNPLRLLLLVVVGAIGMAFAGPALAVYQPFMTVEQTSYKVGAPTAVDFVLGGGQNDDPSAKITIFSPAGYGNNLSQAPGTKLGNAFAIATGAIGPGVPSPLTGSVVVGDPANATLMAQSALCRQGKTTNTAVWLLNLSLLGQNLPPIPLFVNVVGPYVTVEICLPHPSQTTPAGVQLVYADAAVKGVFTNASTRGGYQWAADFTPYDSSTPPKPNIAGTVEYRSYSGLPSSVTLKRVKSKPSVVSFAGKLSVEGLDPKGIQLDLYAGAKVLPAPGAIVGGTGKQVAKKQGKTKGSKGTFSFSVPKVKKKTYFQARFEGYTIQGNCEGASPAGLPLALCKGTDLAPLNSAQVKVNPPPKKKKHK